jgi:glycine/D-amino acid oxidase-like deaminating enzyme
MPSADVVIIGAGILGASVAHARACVSVKHIVVLEQKSVPSCHSNRRNASYYLLMYDTPAFSALLLADESLQGCVVGLLIGLWSGPSDAAQTGSLRLQPIATA